MNRHELHTLQQIRSHPALTITLPTHRRSPENRQDRIRVKNLVDQATRRLLGDFEKRDINPLLEQLELLVSRIDYRHTLDGLAMFVTHNFGRALRLPFVIKERVHVGDSFLTRDLVYAMNRTPRYWTLVLSEKPTRLLEGTHDDLIEIHEEGFPILHEGPGGELALPGGFGVRKSAYRDEYHRKFFRQVDSNLKPFMADDPLPLAVVGVVRFLSFFNEVSQHRDSILVTLNGSHDKSSPHTLSKRIWPLVKDALAEQRMQVLSELDKAVGERKFASTIGEVWRMASDGRGKVLLVEKDYHFPGKVDASGRHLAPADPAGDPEGLDDAVDEIIETVLEKQGRVVFVENGQLQEHQRIALIMRY